MGGFRGATVETKGAIFDALKNNVSFDIDDNSINDMIIKRTVQQDVKAVEDLDAEVERFVSSAIEAGVSKKAAKPLGQWWRAHAVAMRPDNPGQWFKDNFKEIVRAEKEREKRQEYTQIYKAWNDNVIIPVKNYIANSFAKKNNNSTLELWEIGDREAENIHRFISLNLKGFRHLLVDSDIRHIRNTHGASAKKIRADEVRLTDEDFYRIPDILANPDNVTVGNRSSNGDATLRFEKNKNDGTVTIVETIMSDKTLRVKTMWKDKYEGHSANIVNPPNTSKNAHNNLSTVEAIIKQKGIDVKQNNNAYNQQNLGATSWDAAGRATITLMQKADASTLIHESGHVFLEALWNDIQTFHIPKFTFLI